MVFIDVWAKREYLELVMQSEVPEGDSSSGLYLLSANEHFALDSISRVTLC